MLGPFAFLPSLSAILVFALYSAAHLYEAIPGQVLNSFVSNDAAGRGWLQPNFVELWSVSRPRLAEMAIEIWVMCQLTEKLFETCSVRSNLQVRIFVQILGDTSISEHFRE